MRNPFEYYDRNNIKDMLTASSIIFALLLLAVINKYIHYGLILSAVIIIFFMLLGLIQKDKEARLNNKEVKNETQEIKTEAQETKDNKLPREQKKQKDIRF